MQNSTKVKITLTYDPTEDALCLPCGATLPLDTIAGLRQLRHLLHRLSFGDPLAHQATQPPSLEHKREQNLIQQFLSKSQATLCAPSQGIQLSENEIQRRTARVLAELGVTL